MELKKLDEHSCLASDCGNTFFFEVDEEVSHCPYCGSEKVEFDSEEEVAFES